MNTSQVPNSNGSNGGLDHVAVLLGRLRMAWLLRRFPPRSVWSLYIFVNGFLTIALLALLAVLTGSPFVFPSLGPTAYLLFTAPLAVHACPRNTILGHAIGLICGYGALYITGMTNMPYGQPGGVYWPRILAAALSLSATGAFMVLLRAGHPPAGATTMIVSLGIISKPKELVIIEGAVFILVAQALVINRLAGLHYPFWSSKAAAVKPSSS
ncbi:MAG: HPP family protein [Terriglobia bacterium]